MNIVVDYREHELISKSRDSSIQVCNLPVGDISITKGDTILLLVERKTWSDLVASIKDGRFRQQKDRLREATGDPSKILFIIEGSKRSVPIGSNKMVDGAILNLIFKHGMKVVYTSDTKETWSMLQLISDKIGCDGKTTSVAPIKVQSRGDKIKENILATQLSVIPGISFKMGEKIGEVYKTMNDLIVAYNEKDSVKERELMLASIPLNEKRCLGKVTSTKIYNALCVIK